MQYLRLFAMLVGLFFEPSVLAQNVEIPDVGKGEGFEKIGPAQPTQDQTKVEVIEFFWYGCPHCYSFEPILDEWLKNLPENVDFIRQPAIFSASWEAGARAFFIAEALGITDQVHAAIFDTLQKERKPLDTEDQMKQFFMAHGVSEEDFNQNYNSFFVQTRMGQAESMPARYGVTGVPAIIINGKYRTNGTLAKSHAGIIAVMNALIEQEAKKLGTP